MRCPTCDGTLANVHGYLGCVSCGDVVGPRTARSVDASADRGVRSR